MQRKTLYQLTAIAMAALLVMATGKAAAEATGLELAQQPLLGSGPTPNLLLVLDDSTTMDLEVLFRGTRDGVLYWKPNLLELLNSDEDRPTWNNGHFVNGIGPQYAFGYLFPNGINNWINAKDRRASSGYKAIPPLPSMAFARSSTYNKMYFNPNVEYTPWPGMPDATPSMADPAPGVNRTLTEQPPIIYPLQPEEEDDNCGGLLGGILCGLGDLLGSLDDVLTAVGGLVGNILNLGNDEEGQPPEADKVAINLTAERGHFDPGELFTYGSWLPDIPDNRQYIGCTTGSLLLGLVHEDSALQSVLSGDTVETVFGILFGVLTNVNGLLKGALQAWLGNGLIDAVAGLPQLLADLLELVGDSVDNILGVLLGVINLILGGSSNSDGSGFTDVNSLLGGVDGIVHEVIVLVVGLLDVLKIPTPCLNMGWTNSQTTGLLTGLVDNVVKEGVVGQITGFTSKIALQYYPATFYMPEGAPLPDEYSSYKENAKDKIGYTPAQVPVEDQPSLVRFQIKPDNFKSSADYQKAIQNFANWFTYYRKRHLAVRSAIMNTLEDFSHLRVGVTTTNQRNDFVMYDLATERGDLYTAIETLDFSQPNGTPNRKGLQFAGQQLQSNDKIITKACQPNYAMLLTDGYNRAGLSEKVDNVDGGYNAVFSDTYKNSIADVAMKYYQNLTLDNPFPDDAPPVPTPAACSAANPPLRLDCVAEPHMVTYGVTLGQPGEIFNNPGPGWPVDPYTTAVDWPDPNPADVSIYGGDKSLYESVDDLLGTTYDLLNVLLGDQQINDDMLNGMGAEQIDDLWHATVNSRGEMFLAQDPLAIEQYLRATLRKLLASGGSIANLAVSEVFEKADDQSGASGQAGSGTTGNASNTLTFAYQASFMSFDWSGGLIAYALGANGPKSSKWSAAKKLAQTDPDDRLILTSAMQDNGNSKTTPMEFSTDNLNRLSKGLDEPLTADIIDYIRGDQSNEQSEGGNFRNRHSLLGDIVHSDPVYVGTPQRVRYPAKGDWVDLLNSSAPMPENSAPNYSQPVSTAGTPTTGTPTDVFADQERTPMVYVGANDGMLHGFNAKTGEEVLAYIPGVLLDDLDQLTQPSYVHRPYVDGSPAVADVVIDGEWHTVLVGGLRGGGKAIYALDITNPKDFSTDDVLWEFTNADLTNATGENELGYTYGKPAIVRLHNGKWAAVFGNGFGNSAGAGSELFIVDIKTGELIRNFQATLGAVGTPNGMTGVAPVDVDGDFIVDYIYAGDLQGNLWKFDLTSALPDQWDDAGGDNAPLFVAKDADGAPQPITAPPVVGQHPYGPAYGVMVYFGTGQLLNSGAKTGQSNSFYGLWDPNVIGSSHTWTGNYSKDGNLIMQTMSQVSKDDRTYRVMTDKPVHYNDGDRGWYVDLIPSEMVINAPYLRHNMVGFSTALPADGNSCSPGGNGFIMRVSALNGGRMTAAVFDADHDLDLDKDDKVFTPPEAGATNPLPAVGASGLRMETGRPSGATFVPGKDYVLHNTTSGQIQSAQTPELEGMRRTWRIVRP